MDTRIFAQDTAENSVMQTITIAVSTILITAGLVTVPSSIANARDANARTDLDNIAYAQETALSEAGRYFELDEEGQPDDPELPESIEYSLSGGTEGHVALICDAPNPAYLLRVTSSSDTTFYRSSGASVTSSNITDLVVPDCIEDEVALYNASSPEPFYVSPNTTSPDLAGGGNTNTSNAGGNTNASGNSNPNASESGNVNGNANANANGNNGNGGGNGNNSNNGNGNNKDNTNEIAIANANPNGINGSNQNSALTPPTPTPTPTASPSPDTVINNGVGGGRGRVR